MIESVETPYDNNISQINKLTANDYTTDIDSNKTIDYVAREADANYDRGTDTKAKPLQLMVSDLRDN